MFDKFRQLGELKKMRDEAMAMQKKLAQIVLDVEKNGIKVRISADQKIHSIQDADGNRFEKIEEAVNEALKEAQKEAAKEMQQSVGFEGLKGLLGK